MKTISAKRSQIRGNSINGATKSDRDMPYKAIRYISDYTLDQVEEATKAMDKAGAYDVPGIGSWKIEPVGEHLSYLFFPGESTKLGLRKQTYLWMQIGKKTTEKWEENLPGHKFRYILDADAEPPNSRFARFRKHKQQAMMVKDFFTRFPKEKLGELMEKAKKMADEATGTITENADEKGKDDDYKAFMKQ